MMLVLVALFAADAGLVDAGPPVAKGPPPEVRLECAPSPVKIGQKLVIRGGSTGATARTASVKTVTYTVKSGDSLWEIARKNGVTVDSIKRANGLRSNSLKPGQKLRIKK